MRYSEEPLLAEEPMMRSMPLWTVVFSAAWFLVALAVLALELEGYINRTNRGYVVIMLLVMAAINSLAAFIKTRARSQLWFGLLFLGGAAFEAFAMAW
jgi:hypothetical protein